MPIEVRPEMTIVWPTIKEWFEGVVWAKRVCVDLDGVVCEYDFPQIVKGFFGVDIPPNAIFAYDLADVLGVAPSLINTMFKEQVFGIPNFIHGAIETLNTWKNKGYEIVIFSNRVKYMGLIGLKQWLIDWQIPFSGIDGGKGEYDIHIDDSPSKLMGTDSKVKLLFDQPWNQRCYNITGKFIRVKNWKEIGDYV